MRKVRMGMVGIALAVLPFIAARAEDSRCKVPPYGGAEAKFRSFAATFGVLVTPAKVLSGVCNAKFGRDRTVLYNLGFTDSDIDSQDSSAFGLGSARHD
jgi:hypothetical protein